MMKTISKVLIFLVVLFQSTVLFAAAKRTVEKEINQKLFNRTSKGVIPTLHGSTLLNLVDDFSNKLNQFKNNIRKN